MIVHSKYNKEKKWTANLKFGAVFLNPILAFVLALTNIKTKSSFYILFILSLIFGASLSVPNVRTDKNNFDGIAYRINFEKYVDLNKEDYINNFKYYISFTDDTDFFDDTVYFLVSRFTDNYHIMYMLLSIIFSILLLKSLKLLILEDNFKNTLYCFILLYLFISNQIININMFRFYIALWLAVYSILNIFLFRNKVYYLWLIITPFIHASFFILYLLLVAFLVLKNINILKYAFILCLVISGVSIEFLQNSVEFLPDTLGLKVLSYTSEKYMYEINESGSGLIWVRRLFEFVSVGYINFLVLIMLFNYNKCIKGTKCSSLFLFTLLLMCFVNLTLIIPSLGSRFIMMALPFIAYVWLVCFSAHQYKKYIYGLGILFLLHTLLPFNIYQFPCLRYYLSLLEPLYFINSPVVSLVKYVFWY